MASRVEAIANVRESTQPLQAFVQLSKPAVTRLVLVTLFCGALAAPGATDVLKLVVALIGTGLVVAGANALNMLLERDSDAHMERTRARPLPSGRLSPEAALTFGVVVSVLGVGLLLVAVNLLSALVALVALISYAFVYTPLKRVTPLALHVGAVPGALPPVIGWAAMRDALEPGAWVLFAILFVWQLPHFLAIATFRRDEYARAGLRVLPVVRGLAVAKRDMALYSVLLVAVTLVPPWLGLGSTLYVAIAGAAGLVFLAFVLAGFRTRTVEKWARGVFLASMPYLVVVYAAVVVTSL